MLLFVVRCWFNVVKFFIYFCVSNVGFFVVSCCFLLSDVVRCWFFIVRCWFLLLSDVVFVVVRFWFLLSDVGFLLSAVSFWLTDIVLCCQMYS